MTGAPEWTHPIALDTIGVAPRAVEIAANADVRAALAARFGLLSLDRLEADARVSREAEAVEVRGRLRAEAEQACVATGDPVPARIDQPFALRFVAGETAKGADEMELEESDLDTLPHDGRAIDLGEAVAQEFSLALDPFPRCADADARLRAAGVKTEEEAAELSRETGPFAALKALKGE
jgi:uncharacterized metal-binding protein YceD (DUF177 family)